MIRIMDKLWEQEGLQLRLNPYTVVATGDSMVRACEQCETAIFDFYLDCCFQLFLVVQGMLEIVLNSVTYAHITEEAGGASKVLDKRRSVNSIEIQSCNRNHSCLMLL
jgi:hypothetical protein